MKMYVNTINQGTVNMRSRPEKSSPVLMRVPYMTQLDAKPVDELWSKVVYKNKIGYVMTEFLSEDKVITYSDLQAVRDHISDTLRLINQILEQN